MNNSIKCHYCFGVIDSDDFLSCEKCGGNVHTKCLKRPGTPGDLLGDVFFIFTCAVCTSNGREIFIRQKLPWLMIVAIAIHNLSIQAKGLSHHGYFHWRTHITNFIDKNWEFLFPASMRRKKRWVGTVSGILSHNSPDFFISGQNVIQEAGWWKLSYNQTPKFYMKLYEQLSSTRQQLRNDKRRLDNSNPTNDELLKVVSEDAKRQRLGTAEREEEQEEEHGICSRLLPYMGRPPKLIKVEYDDMASSENTNEISSVESSLKQFLEENLTPNLLFNNIPEVTETEKVLSLIDPGEINVSIYDLWNSELPQLDYVEEKPLIETIQNNENTIKSYDDRQQEECSIVVKEEVVYDDCSDDDDNNNDNNGGDDHNENDCNVRIVQVTNFQQIVKEESKSDDSEIELGDDDDSNNNNNNNDDNGNNNEENDTDEEFVCEKSLFTKRPKRELPWENRKQNEDDEYYNYNSNYDNMKMMSVYEERSLMNRLKKVITAMDKRKSRVPPYIRRFYRKLCVRDYKRNNMIPLFNLDTFGEEHLKFNRNLNIIDRYYELDGNFSNTNIRISGPVQYEFFESPHTSRILHPFIYRHSKMFPPWLKVMCELQYVVTGNRPSRSTIDFCYVRPNHIPAVNGLLQSLFWPGIDMSESLSYPDFTVVALYKKLVIGCAFLVPDVGHNEAYISFMAVRPGWQRCGIASFMLYHLTQTCMGKDITLHVSATNSAVCLYQKFGFKIKEIVLDFYEKYLPIESKHSRHALFLRLSR